MKREYTSNSSIQKFTECPAAWLTNYDEDYYVSTRNEYSEVGNLVHVALEKWDKPGIFRDYETLEMCFDEACKELLFGETHEQYARAKELLAAAFRLSTVHPAVPMHLSVTIATEQELIGADGELWQEPNWKLPVKGSIDRVAYIPAPTGKEKEIILLLIDYKTGRMQTHSELTKEKIQAPLYHAYGRQVIVPMLEAQGFIVKRMLMIWTFIGDGTAVTMYDADFNDEQTIAYVGNMMEQQIALEDKWNKILNSSGADGADVQKFLAKHEKPNAYCSYCPRKGQCTTFSRLLEYKTVIDITDPNVTWDELWSVYEKTQAIVKDGTNRLDEIKHLVPVYLDQEKLQSIRLADGREIVANQETRDEYRVDEIRKILGEDFLLRSAKVTKAAVEKELDLISKTDPERARRLSVELKSAYSTMPGPRPVKARKIK